MTPSCTKPAAMAAAICYHRICFALLVSIVWLASDACALPAMAALNTRAGLPRYGIRQQAEMQQLLLNEFLSKEDALNNELKKYQHQLTPNYLNKWPTLRDILQMADYGDDVSDSGDADDSYEMINTQPAKHLRQLGANPVDGIDDAHADNQSVMPSVMPLKKKFQSAAAVFKDHGIKKNVQYMSPCHFKICNMGRKRNARYFED